MNKGFSTYYIYRRMQNNGVLAVIHVFVIVLHGSTS